MNMVKAEMRQCCSQMLGKKNLMSSKSEERTGPVITFALLAPGISAS